MLLRAIMVGVLALTLFAARAQAYETSVRYSAIASVIAERPVSIRCLPYSAWKVPDANGLAYPAEGYAELRVCHELGDHSQPDVLGAAALVLTHEAVHLRGIWDEGMTECLAIQRLPRTLRLLHVTAAEMPLALSGAIASHRAMPAAYRTVC